MKLLRHAVVSRTVVSRTAAACAALALSACLSACGSGQPSAQPVAPSSPAPSPAGALTITDPWVKAAGKGMSAAFGTLVNSTDAPITVVSAATPASPEVELHETVEDGGKMVMRPKQGGFVVPARGSLKLEPGGNHIMLMDVRRPIEPGGEVPFTLRLGDGSTLRFTAVAKDFAGANETYHPGHG
ncbi:copper chaperone PCu(A)C [Thermoactinospora rubra]|uniref:copper chaperone PCu(A)C n=1 Tax=Thermoactinospora rubra TaxID=1088767 RepID=UPI001F0A085B|nr:copper chaperone PCu(A)C [Thermoactinospora rubra]